MKAAGHSALGLARSQFGERPSWALVGEGALATVRTDRITTRELEARPLHLGEVDEHINRIMEALEAYGAHLACSTFRRGVWWGSSSASYWPSAPGSPSRAPLVASLSLRTKGSSGCGRAVRESTGRTP